MDTNGHYWLRWFWTLGIDRLETYLCSSASICGSKTPELKPLMDANGR